MNRPHRRHASSRCAHPLDGSVGPQRVDLEAPEHHGVARGGPPAVKKRRVPPTRSEAAVLPYSW